MQIGFFFDQSRCTGCYACAVACKDWYDIPAGPISRLRVTVSEKGRFPEISLSYLFKACFHCADPACIETCPAEAIEKREDNGIVMVHEEACIGCGTCLDSCPYEAPQFADAAESKMQKCDLCLDRWVENKKPICVQACPMRALDAGPIDELQNKYGDLRKAEGFTYHEDLNPSVIFRLKSTGDEQ